MTPKCTRKFECISPGMYDHLMRCKCCGFVYCESADANPGENERNANHDCLTILQRKVREKWPEDTVIAEPQDDDMWTVKRRIDCSSNEFPDACGTQFIGHGPTELDAWANAAELIVDADNTGEANDYS